jgi:DNA-binding response OmpR family regulator
MPLRIDKEKTPKGVWRGLKWIPLEETSAEFLYTLSSHKGHPIDHQQLQVSKENLHTIAHRLRVAIEPDPSQPIYVKSQRGQGYWLENVI